MKMNEFFDMLPNVDIDNDKAKRLKEAYGFECPNTIRSIISIANEPIFVEGYRVLSFEEILDADDDLGVDFVKYHYIPIVDCGDNDFIVYDFNEECWMKFNIIELCGFSKRQDFYQIMQ